MISTERTLSVPEVEKVRESECHRAVDLENAYR
jgi:hypothetical protein